MSRYALTSAGDLIVSWPTGREDQALVLSRAVPSGSSSGAELGAFLAAALTELSEQLWSTYTHPASAVIDDGENSEHWRRSQRRASVDLVVDILKSPHQPDKDGNVLSSYDPIIECAHQAGRVLGQLNDPGLTQLIRQDVADEVDAVQRADHGDLAGRAAQAVALNRPDAAPTQVAAAHQTFTRNPLGNAMDLREVEPAAAAVAAAHWLHTAATVSAEYCGYEHLGDLIRAADDIEALPVRIPIIVANRMNEGHSAHSVITELLTEAQTTANGLLADPNRLLAEVDHAGREADKFTRRHDADEIRSALLGEIRISVLDPTRPGQDLLEGLLAGIYACWLMYAETSDLDHDDAREEFFDELRHAATHTPAD